MKCCTDSNSKSVSVLHSKMQSQNIKETIEMSSLFFSGWNDSFSLSSAHSNTRTQSGNIFMTGFDKPPNHDHSQSLAYYQTHTCTHTYANITKGCNITVHWLFTVVEVCWFQWVIKKRCVGSQMWGLRDKDFINMDIVGCSWWVTQCVCCFIHSFICFILVSITVG